MFFKFKSFVILLSVYTAVISCDKKETTQESAIKSEHKHPYVKKKPFSNELHGITLNDEYFWMQDSTNAEVVDYLKEENRYIDSVMGDTRGIQKLIEKEFLNRFHSENILLLKINNDEYYSKKDLNDYYPVYYRKTDNDSGKDEVLIDFNKVLPHNEKTSISFFEISPDQQHIAYGLKHENEEDNTLIISNINNKSLTDTIPQVSDYSVWAEDSQTIFYTTDDENGRNDKVFNHKIYLPYEEDKLEYYEEDTAFFVSLQKPKNTKFVLINTESSLSSETLYLDSDDINLNFKVFSSRVQGLKYEVFPHINSFFIMANDKNSSGKKLMKAIEGATDVKNWQVAELKEDGLTLDYIDVFKDYLVVYKSQAGVPYLEIKDLKKNTTEQLNFEDQTAFVKPLPSSFNDLNFRYQYESLLTPKSTYSVDYKTKNKNLIQKVNFTDFNTDLFKEERIYITSEDGNKIPVSLVYNNNVKKDGSAPLCLYIEGMTENESFLSNNSPACFSNRISLLNRGFIFAVAHIRGSRQFKSYWENEKTDLNKKQAINDLLSCANYLIEDNYTRSEIMVNIAEGTGAIIGASALNNQPDLFSIYISNNPKTDLIQIPQFNSKEKLQYMEEFGNPDLEDDFNLMLTFSPYENIEVKAYPDIFIYSHFHNKQISFFEAAKWAARMREYNNAKTELLLKTNFRKNLTPAEYLKDISFQYAFLLHKLKNKTQVNVVAEVQ